MAKGNRPNTHYITDRYRRYYLVDKVPDGHVLYATRGNYLLFADKKRLDDDNYDPRMNYYDTKPMKAIRTDIQIGEIAQATKIGAKAAVPKTAAAYLESYANKYANSKDEETRKKVKVARKAAAQWRALKNSGIF